MGLYGFALAGSNYFAPIICGFIADGQGWQVSDYVRLACEVDTDILSL